MIDLTELDYSIDHHTATSKSIMDAVNDIITLKFKDPLLASKFLPVLAKYYLFTRDKNIVKSIFYICDNFSNDNHTKSIKRYIMYTLFVVYYAMPFYPKAIEYGLQLEAEGFEYPFMELNTYKQNAMQYLQAHAGEEISENMRAVITAIRKEAEAREEASLLLNNFSKSFFE